MTELDRYKLAVKVLREGLRGNLDSDDADEICQLLIKGVEINWGEFPPATTSVVKQIFDEVSK